MPLLGRYTATKGHRFAARYGAKGILLDAAKGVPEYPEGYAIGRKSQLLQTGLVLLKTTCQQYRTTPRQKTSRGCQLSTCCCVGRANLENILRPAPLAAAQNRFCDFASHCVFCFAGARTLAKTDSNEAYTFNAWQPLLQKFFSRF